MTIKRDLNSSCLISEHRAHLNYVIRAGTLNFEIFFNQKHFSIAAPFVVPATFPFLRHSDDEGGGIP